MSLSIKDKIKNHVARMLCATLHVQPTEEKSVPPGQAQSLEKEPVERRRGRRACLVLTRLVPVSATPHAWLRARSQQQHWNLPGEDRERRGLSPPGSLLVLRADSPHLHPGLAPQGWLANLAYIWEWGGGELLLTAHPETNGNYSTGSPVGMGLRHTHGSIFKMTPSSGLLLCVLQHCTLRVHMVRVCYSF